MPSKLTLLIDDKVVNNAKYYAHNHGISLSKMVEQYFRFISDKNKTEEKMPPITKDLIGIATFKSSKTDKALLIDALNKKYI